MQKKYILILLALIVIANACTKSNPVNAIEYAQAYSEANKDKEITVKGFLQVIDKVPCLKIFNPKRDCAFKFLDRVNVVGKELVIDLPEGNGKNEVETPEFANPPKPTSVFTRDQVKIRLNNGTIITPQPDISTPVIVTGKLYLRDNVGQQRCTIYATKVEKK